jgi:hypothetical protein
MGLFDLLFNRDPSPAEVRAFGRGPQDQGQGCGSLRPPGP